MAPGEPEAPASAAAEGAAPPAVLAPSFKEGDRVVVVKARKNAMHHDESYQVGEQGVVTRAVENSSVVEVRFQGNYEIVESVLPLLKRSVPGRAVSASVLHLAPWVAPAARALPMLMPPPRQLLDVEEAWLRAIFLRCDVSSDGRISKQEDARQDGPQQRDAIWGGSARAHAERGGGVTRGVRRGRGQVCGLRRVDLGLVAGVPGLPGRHGALRLAAAAPQDGAGGGDTGRRGRHREDDRGHRRGHHPGGARRLRCERGRPGAFPRGRDVVPGALQGLPRERFRRRLPRARGREHHEGLPRRALPGTAAQRVALRP
mmetsp:Transcript_66706/g.217127  ORF Transcript_66706/g.217127 Transcript_66706/m.217127 type:complete len:316 (+) Transcript_66706:152-1099(+)